MSIHYRLSKVTPSSLTLMNRAFLKVYGAYLFTDDELNGLRKKEKSARRAAIITKLQLQYPDTQRLRSVHRYIIVAKLRRASLYMLTFIIVAIGASYLIFKELPRAYTIGHDVRLNHIGNNVARELNLNLYALPFHSGTDSQVESMLYIGNTGDQGILQPDHFLNWLFRVGDTYSTDTANLITDPALHQAYRAFFSEFMPLSDTLLSFTVKHLDISSRKIIFDFVKSSDTYAGAVLAHDSKLNNDLRLFCPGSLKAVDLSCLLPFYVDKYTLSNGRILFFKLKKNQTYYNVAIKIDKDGMSELKFLYKSQKSDRTEDRDLIWLVKSSQCTCMESAQYFANEKLYAVYLISRNTLRSNEYSPKKN